MKRLLFLLLFVGASAFVQLRAQAPPAFNGYQTSIDTITVTTQFEDGFMVIDSLITVSTDTSYTFFLITGVAILDPNERLYIGYGNDSANCVDSATCHLASGQANPNYDTVLVHESLGKLRGKARVNFSFQWFDSSDTQTDITDTIYVNMTTGSSSSSVEIEDFVFTAHIANRD